MRIYIMRHAEAVPAGSLGYPQDALRPLTEAGHLQAYRSGAGLKRLKLDIRRIISSPLLRGRQTAEEAAKALGFTGKIEEWTELDPDAPPREATRRLGGIGDGAALFVGHEPHLSSWVAELVSGSGGMNCVMKKGAVACVMLDRLPPPPGGGALRWLMTAKHLALIGKG